MPQFLVTGTVAKNPNPLVAKGNTPFGVLNAQSFTVRAQKTMDATAAGATNAGTVTLGHDNTPTTGVQPLPFNPGDERIWPSSGRGSRYDLTRFYFNVANDGDGLVVIYE